MDYNQHPFRAGHLLGAVLIVPLLALGCGGGGGGAGDGGRDRAQDNGNPSDDGSSDGEGVDGFDRDGSGAGDAADAARKDGSSSCVPTTSCAGLCGIFKDQCSGEELSCGPCATGEVCQAVTHTCTKPLTTCQQLGAECGLIKNSCGQRINCGDCAAGQECDPDVHRCVPCAGVTCQDLGYECGDAWLGCGPSTNKTNCGTCASGKTCNKAYNVCEPACTPQSASVICAAAKTARGVQCGVISDGCGGTVDCGGCPSGQGCGQFGVANRCDPVNPADECAVQGKNCGTITSACGGTVSCGSCTSPQVCNSNNVCGAPCTPKKCVDFAPLECGSFDDGCGGTLNCGCSATGALCKSDHTCCVNTAQCQAGSCNTSVTNTCTGAAITCNTCTTGQYCDKTSNTCKARLTCAELGAGGTNTRCNDNPFYDVGGGTKIKCSCSGGRECVGDSTTKEGQCCLNTNPVCAAPGQPGSCGIIVTNSCTNVETTCTCPNGYHCEDTTCLPNDCTAYTNGALNQQCSNGPSSAFRSGSGTSLTCPCQDGLSCVNSSGQPVTGGTVGTCRVTCDDITYEGNPVTGAQDSACSNGPAFASGVLTCACESSLLACVDATDKPVSGSAIGMCKLRRSCADYSATGAIGSACSTTPYFDDGFGTKFGCPCSTTGGYSNNKCIGQTSTQAGACQCTPVACTCANSGMSDGCGGTLKCPCASGTSCVTSKAVCCPNTSCSALPAGIPAGSCGSVPDSCKGTNLTCNCDTTSKPNNKCVIPAGQTWGSCVCTPKTCTGQVGVFDDGCGGKISCTG